LRKVGCCSAGRHQRTAPNRFGGTIGYGTGFVNSGAGVGCALKLLEKAGTMMDIGRCRPFVLPHPAAVNQKRRICALPELYC
jgi:hypothetical protein